MIFSCKHCGMELKVDMREKRHRDKMTKRGLKSFCYFTGKRVFLQPVKGK
jgi:hypothetical protein